MMKKQRGLPAKLARQAGDTILIVMLVVAGAALLFGFLVIRQRIKTPPPVSQTDTTAPEPADSAANTDQTSQVPPTPVIPATWKVYNNDKYSFNMQYPPNLKVGTVSGNSVLGTFQAPVRGFHVGPLVLVVLRDAATKKLASDYFNESYNLALHPPAASEGQGVACKVDNIQNSNASVKSVSCNGEGGPAKYAYITGTSYDVFVDGYSKGFDTQDFGSLGQDSDYGLILGSFKFGTATVSAVPAAAPAPAPASNPTPPPAGGTTPPAPNPAPTPAPNPTPVIKTFSINANDSSATPSVITVAKGTIVEITFNVAATNVYYGGLDFRSSTVNSGTILAGQSKTISFTANQSFSFIPYWPASQVAKGYKIDVTVQ